MVAKALGQTINSLSQIEITNTKIINLDLRSCTNSYDYVTWNIDFLK